MPDWSTLILFVTAASILVFIPGPNTLYIIARSIQQGRIAGIVSSLGVQTGTWFHIVASAFGLSALVLTSATAFTLIKYAGAGYLIYLGIKTLLSRREQAKPERTSEDKWSRLFYQGILVQVLNPKTALFFFSFLPQFVDVEKGAMSAQILFFGGVLIVLGASSDIVYALLAGGAANFFSENLKFLRAQRYFAGTVYIGLGIATAFTGTNKR